MSGNDFDTPVTTTGRSASGNENDLSRTPSTAVKMDVFAPTPSAIVSMASDEKAGFLISARALYRKSLRDILVHRSLQQNAQHFEHVARLICNLNACHRISLKVVF